MQFFYLWINLLLFDRILTFAKVNFRKNRQPYFRKFWASKYLWGQWCCGITRSFPVLFLEELRDITTSFNLKLYSEHNSRDLLKLTCSITAKKNTTPKLYFTKKRRRKRKSKRLLQKQLPYRSETSALLRGPSTVSKTIYGQGTKKTGICKHLGSCDLASWAKCEERKNQQDATIRCLSSTSVSTFFGQHYTHLQENKDRVLLHMVYCVGSAGCGW